MSMLSLRLPESLHRKVRELASKESISINQFITTAVVEKMADLLTEEYLEERAWRADPAVFDRILARAPDVPPLPGDERGQRQVTERRPSACSRQKLASAVSHGQRHVHACAADAPRSVVSELS